MLVTQGAEGDKLYLLLDGVLGVEVDGEQVAEMGPGTIVGERASLEGGVRTATLRALTPYPRRRDSRGARRRSASWRLSRRTGSARAEPLDVSRGRGGRTVLRPPLPASFLAWPGSARLSSS